MYKPLGAHLNETQVEVGAVKDDFLEEVTQSQFQSVNWGFTIAFSFICVCPCCILKKEIRCLAYTHRAESKET
jgi:hypothetical protein